MAEIDGFYVESPLGMAHLTKSWNGPIGRYILRQTRQAAFFSRQFAPKPGGPGHGATKINFATGQLFAGIMTSRGRSNKGELEGRVIALPEHALWVHEGTDPHVIKAKNAPKLVFFWHKAGRVVSFDKVNHPGNPADPFMVKGLKRAFNRQ